MAKKKIKKFLKKALPIAALGLGAMGLARRRATDAPGNAMARAKRLMTSDRAYTGGGYDDHIRRAAKRGFGRALMKGKK